MTKEKRRELTDLGVERQRPPATGRIEIWDKLTPGFAVRISAAGHKSWILKYRVAGKQHLMTIGTLIEVPKVEDARDLARAAIREAKRGIDPLAVKKAAPPEQPPAPLTVRVLAADFTQRHMKKKNRKWKDCEGQLKRHVLTRWGNRLAEDIRKKDVLKLLAEVQEEGLTTGVNRLLALVRKMFNWAVEQDLLESAPTAGVKAPAKEVVRDRALTDDELVRVWRAAEAVGGPAGAHVQLMILTGQRLSEVAQMTWAELDLEEGVWTLSPARTKAKRKHLVPLSPPAIAILRSLPRLGAPVLTTRGPTRAKGRPAPGPGEMVPISGFTKNKDKMDAKIAELAAKDAEETGREPFEMPPWTNHDLRRTIATGLDRLRVREQIISAVLNHARAGVTAKVYIQSEQLDEKREALNAWARRVEALLQPAGSNVVGLARG